MTATELRRKVRKTQKEFADSIGFSVKTVQSWDSGLNKRKPSDAAIDAIDRVYGVVVER